MTCGKKLKGLRHHCAFSTAQVADALGVSEDDIIAIESDKKPPTTTMLDKFCSLYNCERSYILGDGRGYSDVSRTIKFAENGVSLNHIIAINKILANLNFLRNL